MIPLLGVTAGILALVTGLELLMAADTVWRRGRRPLAVIVLTVRAAAALALGFALSPAGMVLAMTNLYDGFNTMRVLRGRSVEPYLRHAVLRTSVWLGFAGLPAWLSIILSGPYPTGGWRQLALGLAGLQAAVAVMMLVNIRRQLAAAVWTAAKPAPSADLPTLSVAVPARNEAASLEACLTAILASDYPKLEVLAFDDDSSDRTPDIIRQFAHAGVRFLRDGSLRPGWLPKNQAYDTLAQAASGQYVLFCGADIRLSPHGLKQLVAGMRQQGLAMVSVNPQYAADDSGSLPPLQAMRCFWELALPRRLFRRPPVLSSCWIVERRLLAAAGGLASVRNSMTPEAHMAAYAVVHGGYRLVRSDQLLGVTSHKPTAGQRETAIYRRYPQAHRRPEVVLAATAGELWLLAAPLPLAAAAAWLPLPYGLPVAALAVAAALLHGWSFALLSRAVAASVPAQLATARRWRPYGLQFLRAVLLDVSMLNLSMWRYECSSVLRKGRRLTAGTYQ